MKYFRAAGVLLLLFIFPFISYLYLKSGYNFRFNALQELKPKEKLDPNTNFPEIDNRDTFQFADSYGKVTIFYNEKAESAKEMLLPIYEEFEHKSEFNIIGFADTTAIRSEASKYQDFNKWNLILGKYPFEKEICLVDTGLMIRNYYGFDSSSFEKLGQHIPIILPREVEKDVVMKDQKTTL